MWCKLANTQVSACFYFHSPPGFTLWFQNLRPAKQASNVSLPAKGRTKPVGFWFFLFYLLIKNLRPTKQAPKKSQQVKTKNQQEKAKKRQKPGSKKPVRNLKACFELLFIRRGKAAVTPPSGFRAPARFFFWACKAGRSLPIQIEGALPPFEGRGFFWCSLGVEITKNRAALVRLA